MENLKEKIIFHVFEFLETGEIKHSQLAKGYLQMFAKKYHVKIKSQKIINIKDAFKAFIINEKGYVETINKLFNSL